MTIAPLLLTLLFAVDEPAIAEIPAVSAVRPPLGVVFHGHITNVVDGDTLDVACGDYTVRIRLLDCWCAEKTGATKEAGLAAMRSMIRLAADKPCYVQIPVGHDIKKSLSLDRFLGRVWVAGDEVDLSTHQVRLGHATRMKAGK